MGTVNHLITSLIAALCAMSSLAVTHAQTVRPANTTQSSTLPALRMAVVNGFMPAFRPLIANLERRSGHRFDMINGSMEDIYTHLHDTQPVDVIITANPNMMQQAVAKGLVHADSVAIVGRTVPVLWCPSPDVIFRVSFMDTLSQTSIRTLSSPVPLTNPLGQLLSGMTLPPNVRLIPAQQGIEAWRMVRRKKADCALTVKGLVGPFDRYQIISDAQIDILAAVPTNSRNAQAAHLIVQQIKSPLMQARLRQSGF